MSAQAMMMPVTVEQAIRVAIVEDDDRTREAIELLLEDADGYECCGAYASVEAALASPPVAPDVLLQDIHLPGMQGTEAVPEFRSRYPAAKILMFTVFDDDAHVFRSICNGADGYLLKKTAPARLLAAVREAHEDGAPMSPEIARKVVTLFRDTQTPPSTDHDLNPTEVRILGFLADGHSYKSVGETLDLSINTIRWYIRSIYGKLHVHSKSEAVGKALREKIL